MKMTNLIFGMMMTLASASAFADGWVCESTSHDLNVKVYDHVQPNKGTRNAAVMVFSDPAVQDGRKTIATFNDVDETLVNHGMTYTARADKAVEQGARGGEYIAGTRLMYVRDITLAVNAAYNQYPTARAGDKVSGEVILVKLNGERIQKAVSCARYLKNS